ncbi:hypothetical protein M949_0451 [Riemerella anatipestifer CH3]|uniref:STM3941 family protein n=1 Tax=Riemerella anatipestifer TaxID=34085 RepID=UPI0004DC3710|nr:STM3941 family protein [Riemerella anatipestifer]AIH01622.1 hypothetical protein M949_0451 [Riemerella anatipestifer CH3]QDE20689.1 hypothetical protein FIP52_10100 [Riemerella anatipestifer]
MNKIEIPINKTKMILLVILFVLFMIINIYMFINADEIAKNTIFIRFSNPTLNRIMSAISFLFFTFFTFYGIKKILKNKRGLTIDDNGIDDQTSSLSAGFIEWDDITELKTETLNGLKFFLVYVKNPDKYLHNASGMKLKAMKNHFKNYGTPLTIEANVLKYRFDDLEKLLKEKLKEKPNR